MMPHLTDALRAYPTFIALAVICAVLSGVWNSRRVGVEVPIRSVLAIQILLAAGGLAGGRLYAAVERLGPDGIMANLLSSGAYRQPGALAGALCLLPLVTRLIAPGVSALRMGDVLFPSFAVAMAVERVGCFLEGCCYGVVSNVPWAVRFPSGSAAWSAHVTEGLIAPVAAVSLPVHPLQIYLGVYSLLVATTAYWWERRKTTDGQILCLVVIMHEGGKCLLEYLRGARIVHVQESSFGLMVLAILLLIVTQYRSSNILRSRPNMSPG